MEPIEATGSPAVARDPTPVPDPACAAPEASKRIPCDVCGHPMEPEHAHYRCPACHHIQPCCGW